MSRYGRGRVLRAEVDSTTYAANYYDPRRVRATLAPASWNVIRVGRPQ